MPQVIALLAVGAGLLAGYKWLKRTAAEAIAEQTRAQAEAEARARVPREMGELEWDAAAEVYRPRRGA